MVKKHKPQGIFFLLLFLLVVPYSLIFRIPSYVFSFCFIFNEINHDLTNILFELV